VLLILQEFASIAGFDYRVYNPGVARLNSQWTAVENDVVVVTQGSYQRELAAGQDEVHITPGGWVFLEVVSPTILSPFAPSHLVRSSRYDQRPMKEGPAFP
jgi:hypothetical protein